MFHYFPEYLNRCINKGIYSSLKCIGIYTIQSFKSHCLPNILPFIRTMSPFPACLKFAKSTLFLFVYFDQHVFLLFCTPFPKRTRFLASSHQEVQNRGACWWRFGLRFTRAGMDSQGHTAWLFLLISRQKPQNALFPPWLEIPVHASLMYGLDGVNAVSWASRQTDWLLSEDPEHKWGHRNLSGNHSSSFPCRVQH